MPGTCTRVRRAALLLVLLLGASCTTSSQLVDDRLSDAASIAAVDVGLVNFDYASWTTTKEEVMSLVRERRREWERALQDAFLAEANARGLGGGERQRVRVDITIDDLDPGSRAARYWLGMGAGEGFVCATAHVRGHGEFRMRAAVIGGMWGGDFESAMAELGEAMAGHLADQAGK